MKPDDLRELLRADGSVICPPQMSNWLLRALVRDLLDAKVAGRSGNPNIAAVAFLDALNASAIREDELARSTATGTELAGIAKLEADELMTVAQCAAILECSPEAVRKACRQKRLPAQQAGGIWLIQPRHLDTYRFNKKGTTNARNN